MKRLCYWSLSLALVMGLTSLALAAAPDVGIEGLTKVAEDRPDAPWITQWYALDSWITENGGHGPGSEVDWVELGTDGVLNDSLLSTSRGLGLTLNTKVNLPDNGGTFGWTIITIDPADGDNMHTAYGEAVAQDNLDTYAIIVIDAPAARTITLSPAHDDHAQIFINGEKVYGNGEWTGAAQRVSYDVDTDIDKGENVLLYRCSEGGGSAYFNLHLDDATMGAVDIYPQSDDVAAFFGALETAVEPVGKLGTVWGELKQ